MSANSTYGEGNKTIRINTPAQAYEAIQKYGLDPNKIGLRSQSTAMGDQRGFLPLQYYLNNNLPFDFNYRYNDSSVSEKQGEEVAAPQTLDGVVITAKRPIKWNLTQEDIQKQKEEEPHWYDYANNNFKDTFGFTPKQLGEWIPGIGDVLFANDIYDNFHNGNYKDAAIGTGMFFLPSTLRKAGKYAKDLWWLTKYYNKVGTGLKDKYVRKKFTNLAKDPTTARNFIERYGVSTISGPKVNLDQMKKIQSELEFLEQVYGIQPKADWASWDYEDTLKYMKENLAKAKQLKEQYFKDLEYLKNNNEVLYNIASESPQYLNQIARDLESGKITNTEEYVKRLIDQSNTFIRRMNLSSPSIEPFSTIKGSTLGNSNYAMDVGNPNVVLHPLWSRNYGNVAAVYTPKNRQLQGPVETWWGQRFPVFGNSNITVQPAGMHTRRSGTWTYSNPDAVGVADSYLEKSGIPKSYDRTDSHMIFLSPEEGASIADQFNIQLVNGTMIPNIPYTLGYKKGGKLIHKKNKQS